MKNKWNKEDIKKITDILDYNIVGFFKRKTRMWNHVECPAGVWVITDHGEEIRVKIDPMPSVEEYDVYFEDE